MLGEQWRAFISEQPGKSRAESRYRLYHLSLRDFITGRVKNEVFTHDTYLVDELQEQVAEAHKRIVRQYRGQCDEQWEILVPIDSYARNYLITHLYAAEPQTMFNLVAHSDVWGKAREPIEGNYSRYLLDLDLAWRWSEENETWSVGNQIRCAVIKSCIHTLDTSLPTEPTELAKLNDQIDPINQVNSRLRALTAKANRQRGENRSVLGILSNLLSGVEDDQVVILSKMASYFPSELMGEVLAAARAIQNESKRADALK